jgi:hypothetical protein
MRPTTSKRTTRAQSSAADPAATAATLAERRPEDIVDLLNQNKSEFAAAVLLGPSGGEDCRGARSTGSDTVPA